MKASPLAKKVARDGKVDLSKVKGTGPGGRIVRRDVEAALSGGKSASSTPQPSFAPMISSAAAPVPGDKVIKQQSYGKPLVDGWSN